MCIIVAKPKNIAMPSMETLRNCFDNNPDGAGYMIATGKTVRITKGLMKWEDFKASIESEGNLTESAIVMHFRIATHGKVQPSCCHPFPVSDDMNRLKETQTCDTLCAAHNGVISGMDTSDDVSDTMAYIATILAPLRRIIPSLMYSDDALQIMKETLGSKMVLLDASGELATIGDFLEQAGVLYSNTSYTKKVSSYRSYASAWDAYDEVYAGYVNQDNQRRLPLFDPPYDACEFCPECSMCLTEGVPYCFDEQQANLYAGSYGIAYSSKTTEEDRYTSLA